jgi:hypothetical protein
VGKNSRNWNGKGHLAKLFIQRNQPLIWNIQLDTEADFNSKDVQNKSKLSRTIR